MAHLLCSTARGRNEGANASAEDRFARLAIGDGGRNSPNLWHNQAMFVAMASQLQFSAVIACWPHRRNRNRCGGGLGNAAWRHHSLDLITMTDAVRKLTPLHDAMGRFAKGNPGRPKGAVGKQPRALLAQVKAMGPDAVQKTWEAVMAGERWAIELVLSHVLPRDRTLEWEGVEPDDIREAIKAGDIGSDEAARLATALAKISEIEDLTTIRERLDELEQAIRDAK